MDNRAIHKFEIVKHIGKLSYINNLGIIENLFMILGLGIKNTRSTEKVLL